MTDKETKKSVGEVVEKRIKPKVIRRRAVPKVEEAPKEEVAAKAVDAAEAAPKEATSKKGADEKAEPTAEPTAESTVEPTAERKAESKAERKAEPTPELKVKPTVGAKKKAAKKASATEEPKQTPDAKKGVGRKEVKVFGKDEKKPRPFAPRPVFRRGKGRRQQFRQPIRRAPVIQSGRELKKTEITETKTEKKVVRFAEAISVSEFSQKLGVKAGEIIRKLMALDIMVTVNEYLDIDTATVIAEEYGFVVESVAVQEDVLLTSVDGIEDAKGLELLPRPPVVTVMGHVDHGKTSLLDAIRRKNVVSGEAGGITQHIGAYHVHLDKGDVTFLDTPGHEAFTSMRARGAKATDIVVLVVAADDGVMPQTVEAINHAKAAGVPIIVAINKIDLPAADSDKIKQSLTEYELVPEDWGGETLFVEVSAKQNKNIKGLLEAIILHAEMLELKAPVASLATGVVVEAELDKGKGPVATVLVQSGTLKTGDSIVAGIYSGRVRAMVSDWGVRIKDAGPSMPVEIQGLTGVPEAGDIFTVVKDDATGRQIAEMRLVKNVEQDRLKSARVSLEDLYEKITAGDVKELNVVVKGDVHGSIEAVRETLEKLSTDAVTLKIIHSAAGGITEGDIMLASASNAIVIGFNVRPETKATKLAEAENVDVRLYNVIYNLVDDMKNAMEGLLEPIVTEEVLGRAEVREVFRVSKVGVIAGSYVTDGKITRGAKLRLLRDNVIVYEGDISSLKRFKDDAKEVATGYECGIGIEGYNDIKVGDVIEAFVLKEEAAKL
jgi:translation initiation factor IF-2